MITIEMVRDGYRAGYIRLETDPTGDGTVCRIGDNFFYFGGLEGELYGPKEYAANVPEEDIVKEIFDVLQDFETELPDEYLYYELYCSEHSASNKDDESKENTLDKLSSTELVDELLKRKLVLTDAQIYSLLEASGYFAWKLWTRQDIAGELREYGYEDSDANIDAVLNTKTIKSLRDCTDDDWEIISMAIEESMYPNLPDNVTILVPEGSDKSIEDILSDTYGYCVTSYSVENQKKNVYTVSDIQWDV